MNNKLEKLISYFFFIFVALFWGLSFLIIKETLAELDTYEVLAARWGISAAAYLLAAALGIVKVRFKGKNLKGLLLLVLCQPCCYSLFECLGVDKTTATESSILIAAVPIIVIVEEFLILKKVPVKMAIIGVLIGFSGVVLSILPGAADSDSSHIIGYICLLIAITVGAYYNMGVSLNSDQFSVIEISFAMSVSGGIFFNILSLVMGNGLHPYKVFLQGGPVTWQLLFLGLGCGVLCYAMYNYNLDKISSTVASCIQTNSINVVGVVAGIMVLHEPWGWYTVIGVMLTVTGIVICALSGDKKKALTTAE